MISPFNACNISVLGLLGGMRGLFIILLVCFLRGKSGLSAGMDDAHSIWPCAKKITSLVGVGGWVITSIRVRSAAAYSHHKCSFGVGKGCIFGTAGTYRAADQRDHVLLISK